MRAKVCLLSLHSTMLKKKFQCYVGYVSPIASYSSRLFLCALALPDPGVINFFAYTNPILFGGRSPEAIVTNKTTTQTTRLVNNDPLIAKGASF